MSNETSMKYLHRDIDHKYASVPLSDELTMGAAICPKLFLLQPPAISYSLLQLHPMGAAVLYRKTVSEGVYRDSVYCE